MALARTLSEVLSPFVSFKALEALEAGILFGKTRWRACTLVEVENGLEAIVRPHRVKVVFINAADDEHVVE